MMGRQNFGLDDHNLCHGFEDIMDLRKLLPLKHLLQALPEEVKFSLHVVVVEV